MFVTEPSRSFQRDVIAISTTAVGLLKGNERGEEEKRETNLGKVNGVIMPASITTATTKKKN